MGRLMVPSLNLCRLSQISAFAFRELYTLEALELNWNDFFLRIQKLKLKFKEISISVSTQPLRIHVSDNTISACPSWRCYGWTTTTTGAFTSIHRCLDPTLGSTHWTWEAMCGNVAVDYWAWKGGWSQREFPITVRCSHPETLKGQYLHAISSPVIHGADKQCSRARSHVQSKPTHSCNGSWATTQTSHHGDRYHTQRRVSRNALQLMIKPTEKGNAPEVTQY